MKINVFLFDKFDYVWFYSDVDIEAQFSLNQSRAEEITMREDYGNISALVTHEEGFGDMGFDTDTPELLRHATGLEQSLDQVIISLTLRRKILALNAYAILAIIN